MTTLRVIRLDDKAVLPAYQSQGAAGLDLAAVRSVEIPLGAWFFIPTGLVVEIPCGYEGQCGGGPGWPIRVFWPRTIDSDYRGEVAVILFNLSGQRYRIEAGERIAQLIISRAEPVAVVEVQELSRTGRDAGGFGSTGK